MRLKAEGFSDRRMATAIGSARSTVQECVRRARDAGVTWPLPPTIDEAAPHVSAGGAVVAHTNCASPASAASTEFGLFAAANRTVCLEANSQRVKAPSDG